VPGSALDQLIKVLKPETPVTAGRSEAPQVKSKVRGEVMFGPLQPIVLGYRIKQLAVRNNQVIDALDVVRMQLVLNRQREKLNELHPRSPRWVLPHRGGEQRIEELG